MGRDLLCKLREQITFYSNGAAALKLRRLKTKTLILTVIKEDKWWPYARGKTSRDS
jgi:hypothetical protein